MQLQLAAMAEGKAHELGPIVLKRKAGGPRRVDRSRIQKLAHRRARGKLPSRNAVLKFNGVLGEQELGVPQRAEGDKVGDEPARVGFVAIRPSAPPEQLGEGSLRLTKGGDGFGRGLLVESSSG